MAKDCYFNKMGVIVKIRNVLKNNRSHSLRLKKR